MKDTQNKYLKRLSQHSFVPRSRRAYSRMRKQEDQPPQMCGQARRSLQVSQVSAMAEDKKSFAKQRDILKSQDLGSHRDQREEALLVQEI